MDSGAGRGAESRRARLVQIRRLLAQHRVRSGRCAVAALAFDSTARHQLFRVSEDLLSDRSAAGGPAYIRVPRFLHVRFILPAARRRPVGATQRDYRPVPARPARPRDVGEFVAWLRAVHRRCRQESATGRHAGAVGRSLVREGAKRAAIAGRGLGSGRRLHAANLLRLCRLFRYGHRSRPDVRPATADELRRAVQGGFGAGFLAALAHDPQPVSARLSVYSARRQPLRAGTAGGQRRGDDAAGQHLLRRGRGCGYGTVPHGLSWFGAGCTDLRWR